MVIKSLKMDQYPFRPWDEKFCAIKVLMYIANRNRLDIAFANTQLAQNSATPIMPIGWSEKDDYRYFMATEELDFVIKMRP